jgi:hypothetical protein
MIAKEWAGEYEKMDLLLFALILLSANFILIPEDLNFI